MRRSLRPIFIAHLIATTLLAAIAHAQAQPTAAGPATLLPADQAPRLPDFLAFRTQLQSAISRRDVQAVTAVLHPDVKLSFGGDDGVSAFAPLWTPTAPDTKLWETLATVLALGGTFEGDSIFTAPYVFTNWPHDLDAFDYAAIIGKGVRVRRAPSDTAAVVATLDYAIVETLESATNESSWVPVRIAGGHRGYVHRRYIRSPIDYRVRFVKRDGRWQMVFFLAGD